MQDKRQEDTKKTQDYDDVRTALSVEAIRQSVLDNLCFQLAKVPDTATMHDWYMAVAYTIRDRMMRQWINTMKNFTENLTVVAYLSAEYQMGPQLNNNLINLGLYDKVLQAVTELGQSLEKLIDHEQGPGLGESDIGNLAASAMDSLSALSLPAIGYGVLYEFGSFRQDIRDGWQVEMTDKWLLPGNPWIIQRPEIAYTIKLGGHTESYYDEVDAYRVRWIPKFCVKGVAHDTPLSGYRTATTNVIRLWKSESVESFEFEAFSTGDYFGAVNEKIASESISKILYPEDEPYAGKQFRLAQQYFFISCALQDMIRLHLLRWENIHTFPHSFAVQLNGTDTAIAVAELMRLLVDEHLVSWEKAWYITQNTFSFTNHSIVPEALEKWPLPLFAGILPRHLEIVYEINRRFLDEVVLRYPENPEKINRLSLIDDSDQKYVRMDQLAGLGSHIISGVSESHTEQLKKKLLPDLHELYPERFLNMPAGITPRRWVLLSNPRLSELITQTIGEAWVSKLEELSKLRPFAEDMDFVKKWQRVKYENKRDLARIVFDQTGISVKPDTLFDIQVQRMIEHKRQHLNVLHIITLYNRIKRNPRQDITPRTFIFGGKASPGHYMANLIIKLIHAIAEVVNNDPEVAGRVKVVFFPNADSKNGQKLYPAADISEQITTAGRERAGTGNITCAMNGALTVGTFNGTNLAISGVVGAENVFLFGTTAEEVYNMKISGYSPMTFYQENPELKDAVDLVSSGFFSRNDINLFKPFIDSLICRDEHMALADYQSYIQTQESAGMLFKDQKTWTRMSVLTVAGMGIFSSDRAVREHNEKIWHATPLEIDNNDS